MNKYNNCTHTYKIAIGMTSVDYKTHWGIVASLFKMLPLDFSKYEFEPIFETGIYIDEIRNRIALKFLESDSDFLIYLDYDNGLPTDWLDLFMEDFENPDVKIVSGAYFFKGDREDMVAGIHPPHLPYGTFLWLQKESFAAPLVNLSKVAASDFGIVGFGCVMLRREVFETMSYPWFYTKYVPVESGVLYWGEDSGFCENAKNSGIDIYLDQRIKSPHMAANKCFPEEWRQVPKDGLQQTSLFPAGVRYDSEK